MVTSESTVLPPNEPSVTDNPDSTENEKELLNKLAKIWKPFQKQGLRVRMQVGELLNERLGPPTERLPHGRRVLKQAAEELQIAESDLSRMRWFAHRFQSVEAFQDQHPGVRSWGKIKKLLADLNHPDAGDTVQSLGARTEAVVHTRVVRSLNDAAEWIRQGSFDLDETAKEEMRNAVEDLLEAAAEYLQMCRPLDFET